MKPFNQVRKYGAAGATAAAATLGLASPAHAAIDVSAAVTAIGDAATPINLIGGASLLILAAIVTYKWIRRAF